MKDNNIIISETRRPFWHLIIAALLFTIALFVILIFFYNFSWTNKYIRGIDGLLIVVVTLISIGLNFSSQKRIYIDIQNSRFKPSFEIGPLKIGKWKTIKNYEYVSIFYEPTKRESEQFEVNLWYDRNKHFELYSRNNFEDAMLVGYDVSEQLNIDLLDATIRGESKWIDKEELKANFK